LDFVGWKKIDQLAFREQSLGRLCCSRVPSPSAVCVSFCEETTTSATARDYVCMAHSPVRTKNCKPSAKVSGSLWQYTIRARPQNSPSEDRTSTLVPGSQGQSLWRRAPLVLTFSVEALSVTNDCSPFESRTRNRCGLRSSLRRFIEDLF
jgi:hypothetical protein